MKIHLSEQEAINQIVASYEAKSSLRESKINQRTEIHYYECANAIAKLREEKNIDSILRTEKFYLTIGKEVATSKNEISSLNEGLRRVGEAEQSLDAVRNKKTYSVRLQTSSLKELDKEGLPRDSFRQFVNSQITSIRNQERAPLSKGEKAVLEARISNLRAANEIYKGLQRMALSKPIPAKGQDRENNFDMAIQKAAQKAFPNNEQAQKQFIDYAVSQRAVIEKANVTERQKKTYDGPER